MVLGPFDGPLRALRARVVLVKSESWARAKVGNGRRTPMVRPRAACGHQAHRVR